MLKYSNKMGNLLPNGGLDLYEGARESFDSVEQLRQSDTFDNLGEQATLGSSSVSLSSPESLYASSHLYRMTAVDLSESCGVTNRELGSERITLD